MGKPPASTAVVEWWCSDKWLVHGLHEPKGAVQRSVWAHLGWQWTNDHTGNNGSQQVADDRFWCRNTVGEYKLWLG